MENLTFIDLFAGVGGFRRGFEEAGHTCLGHCEFDKFANTSYCTVHDIKEGEWFCEDIREARNIPECDVWCFGAPCQDFSLAGKRQGLEGNRSSLVGEVFRLLRETEEEHRPKYLLYENVKGMLSSNKGFDFLEILYQMDKLGYDAEWEILNSKNHNVPQNRERVFVIGHLRGRSTRKIFPIGQTSTEVQINKIDELDCKGQENIRRIYGVDGLCPTLTTMEGGNRQPKILVEGNINSSQDGIVHNVHGISQCLSAGHGNSPKILAPIKVDNYVLIDDTQGFEKEPRIYKEYSPTLRAERGGLKISNGLRLRKLTPLECWRLQGWKDEDFYKAKNAICEKYYKGTDRADSQLYKQAGNGVTTTVIYEIAKRL